MMKSVSLRLFITIIFLPSTNLAGQTHGRVLDEAGNPLISVAVEAWNVSGPVAVAITDAEGKFALDLQDKSASQIIASRLGYSRGHIRNTGADTAVVIRLALLPEEIKPLTVRASRQEVRCPQVEDPRARQLWQAARSRYSNATGERGLTGEGRFLHQPKAKSELGQYDPAWLRWRWQAWNAYHLSPFDALEQRTYGLRIDTDKGQDDFDNETGDWIYPKFHLAAAYHFASDRFGRRHTFYILNINDDSSAVLAYCPLSKNEPEVFGKLAVNSRIEFDWVAWSFITSKPRDEAGGRLEFVAINDPKGGLPHLLPREGIFWRRPKGQSTFEQFVYVFDIWLVSPDKCRPDLTYLGAAERKRGNCTEHFGD